jgi:hypothetical protein
MDLDRPSIEISPFYRTQCNMYFDLKKAAQSAAET